MKLITILEDNMECFELTSQIKKLAVQFCGLYIYSSTVLWLIWPHCPYRTQLVHRLKWLSCSCMLYATERGVPSVCQSRQREVPRNTVVVFFNLISFSRKERNYNKGFESRLKLYLNAATSSQLTREVNKRYRLQTEVMLWFSWAGFNGMRLTWGGFLS